MTNKMINKNILPQKIRTIIFNYFLKIEKNGESIPDREDILKYCQNKKSGKHLLEITKRQYDDVIQRWGDVYNWGRKLYSISEEYNIGN